jgi:hypothetical protein
MWNPIVWVAVAGWVLAVGTYGVQKVVQARQWQAAYDQGVTAGKASASAGAVSSANQTAAAERQATEATPLPADKAAIVELCRKSASCRERVR